MSTRNVIIIGSGPAGYTAAIYAARANLKPLLFEGYMSGGQLMTTTDVENFPGFPDGVMGPEMMPLFQKQAKRFGTECLMQNVDSVDFSQRPFKVTSAGKDYFAHAVIIATGATAKYLGLENEKRLLGKGVSACATCDGAFFKDEKLAIVGGGDTAMEEALFLTRFAKSVTLIHRREEFRASKIMQKRVLEHPKVTVLYNTVVTDVIGENAVQALKLQDVNTKEERTEDFGGFFVAIGHKPNTEIFADALTCNDAGYIQTKADSTYTNVDGVFACGDVQDHIYRQAITAAGTGCMAAIDAERWLESKELNAE